MTLFREYHIFALHSFLILLERLQTRVVYALNLGKKFSAEVALKWGICFIKPSDVSKQSKKVTLILNSASFSLTVV